MYFIISYFFCKIISTEKMERELQFSWLNCDERETFDGDGNRYITEKEMEKMKYDFENKTDRSVTGSSKWYFMKQSVPEIPDGIIPFSVADMELKNAPEILTGLKEFLDEDRINLGYTIPTAGFINAVKERGYL